VLNIVAGLMRRDLAARVILDGKEVSAPGPGPQRWYFRTTRCCPG
jgi:hypothetical protein